jgi:hypothetical protein
LGLAARSVKICTAVENREFISYSVTMFVTLWTWPASSSREQSQTEGKT